MILGKGRRVTNVVGNEFQRVVDLYMLELDTVTCVYVVNVRSLDNLLL